METRSLDEATIFSHARQIVEEEPRRQYIREACSGDERLRARIEALLVAHDKPGNMLDCPIVADLDRTGAYLLSADVGTVVAGRYKLLEKIGEGGMGTVWIAEQIEPVTRKVALKLIKPGMDSRAVLRRFEAERQALAIMDHPHIAKVLDGGLTEFERPYFVMEYVRGVPITECCDAGPLSISERLGLFVQLCKAVQHAHQKGIIHRDLKPSNILVAHGDDGLDLKVIDFGLAKAVHEPLTDQSLHSAYGMIMGTALYMSPEQTLVNNSDVDTRSDIYSLGVLLYELLTGTTPIERRRFQDADWDEVRRLIRDEEPPRPSTRYSASDPVSAAATCRRSDPARLRRQLRGELDWIVMKAVAKDRTLRYETANSLARDIERYLNDEPVEARPPSAVYRLMKFVRRNRGIVGSTVALFLLLIAAIVGTSWGLVRADRARREADEAREAETLQRQEAQAREAETRSVLDFVEKKVFAAAQPEGREGGLGPEVTLRKAIEAALPFVEKGFVEQPLTEARLRMSLGRSFFYLGDLKTAADQWGKARQIYTSELGPNHLYTLRSTDNLATSYAELGRREEALKLREQQVELERATLGPEHVDTLEAMNNLGASYSSVGRHADALRLFEETLVLREAKLGADDPETLRARYNKARALAALGRVSEAVQLHEQTFARRKAILGPTHPDTFWSMTNLAGCYATLGRQDEALRLREETFALQEHKLGIDHPDTIASMNNLALSYAAAGRRAEALKLLEQAATLQNAKLGPSHPRTLRTVYNLACMHALMIGEASDGGKHADLAMESLQKAVAAGFKDLGLLKKDTDLDNLRRRGDFQKLILAVEAKNAPNKQ